MRTIIETENIKKAIKAIDKVLKPNDGIIPAQFTGYIASFGAAIIQSGFIPAVIFFEDKLANSEEKRYLLIEAIVNYLDVPISETNTFSNQLLMPNVDLSEKEDEILEAAMVIKLALRTFKKSKK